MTWATVVGMFALALLLGYRLPIGRTRTVSVKVQSLTLLDDSSLEA